MAYSYTEIGPYSEYSPAHEKALKLKSKGWKTVYIKKVKGQWFVTGYEPDNTQRNPGVNQIIPASGIIIDRKRGKVHIINPGRIQNIAQGYYDGTGFHPIRASSDYDPDRDDYSDVKRKRRAKKKVVAKKRKPAKRKATAKKKRK